MRETGATRFGASFVLVVLAIVLAAAAGCQQQTEPKATSTRQSPPKPKKPQSDLPLPGYALGKAPTDLLPALLKANRAIQQLQEQLMQRFVAEFASGGPVAAISVCRDQAQAIAAAAGKEEGVEVGRTSDRLRNPKNAPRAWVQPYLDRVAGEPAAEVAPRVFDLGDRVGLLRPIPTKSLCMTCHGPVKQLDSSVRGILATAYPDDEAVGFSEGELRGLYWAEARK